MTQKWTDCYKDIIYDICSFDGVWQGKTAQFFPDCHRSDLLNDNNIAEFTTWDLVDSVEDRIFKGTRDPGSWRYCECLPFTPNCHKTVTSAAAVTSEWTPINYMAENFYDNMGRYYWDTYKDADAIDFDWLGLGSLI